MIERFVDVLTAAGLDLTYDQILDAVWLAGILPTVPWESLHFPNAEQVKPRRTEIAYLLETDSKREQTTHEPPTGLADSTSSQHKESRKLSSPVDPTPGGLYVPRPRSGEYGTMRAVPVRVPAAEALPDKRGINAALRPLKRRFPSRRTFILDVTATVEQIANGGPNVPVLRAAPERWLEAALVVDDSISMRVWRDTIREFEALLARHGSFRDVRTWYVNLDDGKLKLYNEAGLSNDPRRLRHARELIDPAARRLILIISDCVAEGWRNKAMFRTAMEWGQRGPVVLVQVLPERLWSATALDKATVFYRASSAASPNVRLETQNSVFEQLRELDGINSDVNLDESPFSELLERLQRVSDAREYKMPLPIINLEGWSVAPWAKLVANVGNATAEGVTARIPRQVVPAKSETDVTREPKITEIDPETRLARFRAVASSGARLLAGYLAVAPMCLPVMRLVQKAMMPSIRQVDLAEVLLSGLLEQETLTEGVAPPEEVFYRFHPGVRELLLNSVTQGDQKRILRNVSRLIEEMTGSTISFSALLAGSKLATDHSREYPVGEKFAEVAEAVARRLRAADSDKALESRKSANWDTPMRVFLSFASANYELAKKVIYQLEKLEWHGIAEFWSAIDLRPNDIAADVSRSRLDSANVFVPFLSGSYLESDWARNEIRTAIEIKMLILPMLLEPVSLEGHPLSPYFHNVDTNPLSSATDEVYEIALFADRLTKEFGERSLASIQESVVKVQVDNVFSCGFFAGPNAQIVIFNTQPTAKTVEVTPWNGTSVMAQVDAFDPGLHLSIVSLSTSLESHRPLPFAPWEKMLGMEAIVVSPGGERWSGLIDTLDPEFTIRMETALPHGMAGTPVVDVGGRVLGAVSSSSIETGKYTCIRADRILDFIRTSTSPALDPPPPIVNATGDPKPRVLVVGTGSYELPARVQNAARTTGASVAIVGGTLITGGWSGVDYLAAEAFTEKAPLGDTNRLLNVLEGDDAPQFDRGRKIYVGRDQGIAEAVQNADLVILIGGAGGTWVAFREALRARKLVLPFINTGTDAYHAGLLLEIFGQNVSTELVRMFFSDKVEPTTESAILAALLRNWSNLPITSIQNDNLLWMAEDVLPVAENYMAKLGRDHEIEANKLFQQLQSKGLSEAVRISLVNAFATDPMEAWRCIAYVALQVKPLTNVAALLAKSLDIEYTLAEQERETRPLWRCLSAIKSILSAPGNTLPPSLFQQLRTILDRLSSMREVDPGGECKRVLSEIISMQGGVNVSSKTSGKVRADKATAKKVAKKVAKKK